MNTQLNEILRLLRNLMRTGIIIEIVVNKSLCRVQTGGMQTTWLNWLTCRAGRSPVWWAPSVSDQVLLLAIGGELDTAFVLPGIFSDDHPAPSASPDALHVSFPDGAVIEYEPENGALTVSGIRTSQNSLRDLNAQASRIDGFRKASAQLAVTGQLLNKAKQEAAALAVQFKNTEKPTKAQARAMEAAKKSAADPKQQKQKVKLKRKPKEQHLRALQHPKATKTTARAKAKKKQEAREGEYMVGESDNVLELTTIYATKAQAMRAAQAKWDKLQRGVAEFSISLAIGHADLFPETPIAVKGFKRVIDEQVWIISRVVHNLNGNGYTTGLELEVKVSDVNVEVISKSS